MAEVLMRDRVAVAVCNWVLNHVASERYRKTVRGSIEYGLRAAARDQLAGALAPSDWRSLSPRH